SGHPLDDETDGLATLRGWMYLPGELTAALARSQLQRLAETTVRSQRNAARLSERLERLPGVEPPAVPRDRTHVFHKYRVRVDPERAGVRHSAIALRDRLLEALCAEGVEAVRWQTAPLPAHPLFASTSGERYPNASAALDSTLVIGSQSYPLFAPPLERFERALAARARVKHAVAFANGTAALHGACWAAGLGPGDRAITTPLTFAATANAVVYQGARPVFADIDAASLTLDPDAVK